MWPSFFLNPFVKDFINLELDLMFRGLLSKVVRVMIIKFEFCYG